jgi:hypothetical protein
VSLRFGWNRYTELFATRLLPSHEVQGLAAHFADAASARAHRSVFAAITRALGERDATPLEKHTRMKRLLEKLYPRVCTDSVHREHWLPPGDMIERTMLARLASGMTPYQGPSAAPCSSPSARSIAQDAERP